jgi:hypothetical protein
MGTLNVILHGSMVFRRSWDDKNRITSIDALIPKFENHVVRAGNWLAETTLSPGKQYTLKGVDEADLSPDYDLPHPADNLEFPGVVRSDKELWDKDLLYATIHLGRPRDVTTLIMAGVKADQFEGTDARKVQPQPHMDRIKIANVQVFTYHFDRDSAISLDDHLWEPVFTGSGNDEAVNLHIFAGHEATAKPREFDDAFRACAELFEIDGRVLDLGLPGPVVFGEKGTRPDGVINEEMEDLSGRTRRLERLGRLQKNNSQLTLISQLWFGFDPVDPENTELCGHGQNDGPNS